MSFICSIFELFFNGGAGLVCGGGCSCRGGCVSSSIGGSSLTFSTASISLLTSSSISVIYIYIYITLQNFYIFSTVEHLEKTWRNNNIKY